MKLIIDIPEDVFKRTVFYREFRDLNDCVTTLKALEKAVLLPKGHGRLIDTNDLDKILRPIDPTDAECAVTIETAKKLIHDVFNKMPTIIEAD